MHVFMDRLARLFALLGGVVLSALVVLICLSIAGRSLNSILHSDAIEAVMPAVATALLATGVGPIDGDFELVEAGMAFAIFAFLPLCHLNGAHASVDIFTAALPARANRFLRMIIEIVFAAVLAVVAWQLLQGTLSKQASGQTTLLLQFPVWWGYALGLTGAIVTAVVAAYIAAMRVLEFTTGSMILPEDGGAEH